MRMNLEAIAQELYQELPNYWPDFKAVAYAFYDQTQVYLFNHPRQGVFPWNEQFVGDTLILFEDVPTAIVNLDFHDTEEDNYSILAHELFHGYQYLKGEKRFPDELLGIGYPLVKENIELRNQERQYLYGAVLADNVADQNANLLNFIALREKRKCIIEEFLPYETAIETVEGPAWLVEYQAFLEKSSLANIEVLQKYGSTLLDPKDSTLHLRKSCLSSGLFICLLLDELLPGWKENFLESELSLYETLKQVVDGKILPPVDVAVSQATEELFDFVQREREKDFVAFSQQDFYHLFIEGEIKAAGFDPMNIVRSGNKLLHKRFLKVRIQNDEFLIQQPVVVEFKEKYRDITRMHMVLREKPSEKDGVLLIEGVGQIRGKFLEEGQTLLVK